MPKERGKKNGATVARTCRREGGAVSNASGPVAPRPVGGGGGVLFPPSHFIQWGRGGEEGKEPWVS